LANDTCAKHNVSAIQWSFVFSQDTQVFKSELPTGGTAGFCDIKIHVQYVWVSAMTVYRSLPGDYNTFHGALAEHIEDGRVVCKGSVFASCTNTDMTDVRVLVAKGWTAFITKSGCAETVVTWFTTSAVVLEVRAIMVRVRIATQVVFCPTCHLWLPHITGRKFKF